MSKLRKFKDYDHYVKEQTKTNKRKLKAVTIKQDELDSISEYAKKHIPEIKTGICHGTRNGYEIRGFRKRLKADIIGTEISETATQFEHTIQWDFHEVKDEWLGNTDFIYSNSLDHSFDPPMALKKWVSCLSDNGRMFIEWSGWDSVDVFEIQTDYADCFGADMEEYEKMFEECGLVVEEVLQHKSVDRGGRRITYALKKV